MNKLIDREQMFNYILIIVSEIAISFLAIMNLSSKDYMSNIFSILTVLFFILPASLSFMLTLLSKYIQEIIIVKFITSKKLYLFLVDKIFNTSFILTCLNLIPIHLMIYCFYRIETLFFFRYYLGFFLFYIFLLTMLTIFYLKTTNKTTSFICTFVIVNIPTVLKGINRNLSILTIPDILCLNCEPKVFILLFTLTFCLILFGYKIVSNLELIGDYKNEY